MARRLVGRPRDMMLGAGVASLSTATELLYDALMHRAVYLHQQLETVKKCQQCLWVKFADTASLAKQVRGYSSIRDFCPCQRW